MLDVLEWTFFATGWQHILRRGIRYDVTWTFARAVVQSTSRR